MINYTAFFMEVQTDMKTAFQKERHRQPESGISF